MSVAANLDFKALLHCKSISSNWKVLSAVSGLTAKGLLNMMNILNSFWIEITFFENLDISNISGVTALLHSSFQNECNSPVEADLPTAEVKCPNHVKCFINYKILALKFAIQHIHMSSYFNEKCEIHNSQFGNIIILVYQKQF